MKMAVWKSTKELYPPKGSSILFWDDDNERVRMGVVEYDLYGYPGAAVDGGYRGFQYWMNAPLGPFDDQRISR